MRLREATLLIANLKETDWDQVVDYESDEYSVVFVNEKGEEVSSHQLYPKFITEDLQAVKKLLRYIKLQELYLKKKQ